MKLFILNFPLKVFFYHPLLIVSLQHNFFLQKEEREKQLQKPSIQTQNDDYMKGY